MSERWYLQLHGESVGPLTEQELRLLASEGSIAPDTPVSHTRSGWRNAGSLPELVFTPSPTGTPQVSPRVPRRRWSIGGIAIVTAGNLKQDDR